MSPFFLLFSIPVVFAVLRIIRRKYAFSALTTLSCAALIVLGSRLSDCPALIAGLLVSAIGDYYLAHTGGRSEIYALGVSGFLIGHLLFIVHASSRMAFHPTALVIGALLAIVYSLYLWRRVLPGAPKLLQLPLVLYALASIAGLICAMMTENPLYIAGISSLVFSDTMIAENDFANNHRVKLLILPTYYLCHILITLSVFLPLP